MTRTASEGSTTSSLQIRGAAGSGSIAEDAVRSRPPYVIADDGAQIVVPELLSMFDREREVVTKLRSRGRLPEPRW